MARPERLDVYFGDEIVGTVHDTAPLAFAYEATWLARDEAMPLAAIPLAPGRQDSPAVQAFFENLLPEGDLRLYIAERAKASTLFAMLLEVAGDTAGGFVILPAGETAQPASYQTSTWEAIAAILNTKSASAIDIKGKGARLSLAGAQDKTNIAIFEDGIPRLPRGTSPSTHILKPDIRRLAKVGESAANETLIMLTAANCGLPTAEVFYHRRTRCCVVRRCDRIVRPDGSLGRLVQYDLCQLAGTMSEKKYEKEGGPGIAQCTALIRRYSTQPAVDLRHFVHWIFFNLYVGNNDSHAKNLSVYRVPGQGVRLTPFYDLMCTRLYPGLSREFAFAIGAQTLPGAMTREHMPALATQLGMGQQFIMKLASDLALRMPVAIGQAVDEVMPSLSSSGKLLAERLHKFVRTNTKKTAARLTT